MDYQIIGDGVQADIYILKLEKYVRHIEPHEFGLPSGIPSINPLEYFITSGDAIKKTISLSARIQELISSLKSQYHDVIRYRVSLELLLKSVELLKRDLEFARGDALFLETEWSDHVLYVIPKNPRAK